MWKSMGFGLSTFDFLLIIFKKYLMSVGYQAHD